MMTLVEDSELLQGSPVQDVPIEPIHSLLKTCSQMERVCESSRGIGLSAVQVGLPWKLFILKGNGCPLIDSGKYGYFINCEYESTHDAKRVISLEECLSSRSHSGQVRHFQVERYDKIRLQGTRICVDGNRFVAKYFTQIYDMCGQSVAFQKFIDMQMRVIVSEIGKEVFLW